METTLVEILDLQKALLRQLENLQTLVETKTDQSARGALWRIIKRMHADYQACIAASGALELRENSGERVLQNNDEIEKRFNRRKACESAFTTVKRKRGDAA